jgi:hypothetical protein
LAAGLGLAVAGVAGAGQLLTWNGPTSGVITDPTKWLQGAAPTTQDNLLWDVAGAYGVTVPYSLYVRRAEVRRGSLGFVASPGQSSKPILYATSGEIANPPAWHIGSLRGEAVTVMARVSLAAPLIVIGSAGSAVLTSDAGIYAENFVVGGVDLESDAIGELRVIGQHPLRGLVGDPANVTIGLAGTGRLSISAGADASIDRLRLGINFDSTGELRVGGVGSTAEIGAVEFGGGSAKIVAGDGAVISVDASHQVAVGGFPFPKSVVVDAQGGEMLLPAGVDAGPSFDPELFRGAEIRASAGGVVDLGAVSSVGPLTVDGADALIRAPALWQRGEIVVRNGGTLDLGAEPFGDTSAPNRSTTLEGRAVLDTAGRIDSFGLNPIPARRQLALGALYPRSSGGITMQSGAAIAVEGLLEIAYNEDSVIAGDGTRVDLTVQPGHEDATQKFLGTLWLNRKPRPWPDPTPGEHPALATLTIAGGATVRGAIVAVDGPAVIDNALLTSDTMVVIKRSSTTLRSGGRIAASDVLVSKGLPGYPSGGTLEGEGVIEGRLYSGNRISPGVAASPIGLLSVAGDFVQSPTVIDEPSFAYPNAFALSIREWTPGALHIDIASPADHDRLEVTGDALLGGTLEVSLLGGFAPAWGDAFTVLTAGAIDGAFETLDLPEAPAGFVYEVEYTDIAATLTLARRTDITRDLVVGAEDLGVLLQQWGTGDGRADVNGDGAVDGADLGIVLGDWGARAR